MKNILTAYLIFPFLIFPFLSHAQVTWSQSGSNTTSGDINISGVTSSITYDDIMINRNKPDAGITVFNSNVSGRSVILFGQGFGGKYGYLAHHSQSYVANAGYTQTYKPKSTTLEGSDINGLGIISANDIRFSSGGDDDSKQRMVINSDGNVGIGTSSPAYKLDVAGVTSTTYLMINSITSGNAQIYFKNQGNLDWDLGTQVGEVTQNFNLFNRAGSSIALSVNKSSNNVGIGTTNPGSFKLAVEGKIGAREVNVLAGPGWPDYVFENNYNLPTLEELNTYIKINKHLPEIPSACTMEENGVNLGEMNMLLLKKVEELTLYVIEQNQKLLEQNNKIVIQKNILSAQDEAIKLQNERIARLENVNKE